MGGENLSYYEEVKQLVGNQGEASVNSSGLEAPVATANLLVDDAELPERLLGKLGILSGEAETTSSPGFQSA